MVPYGFSRSSSTSLGDISWYRYDFPFARMIRGCVSIALASTGTAPLISQMEFRSYVYAKTQCCASLPCAISSRECRLTRSGT
jgi:hypothetical protein